MAQLFDVNIPAISKHQKNIFDEGELQPDATVSKMEIVQMEGREGGKKRNNLLFSRCHYCRRLSCFFCSCNKVAFRQYALLPDKGKINREMADRKAEDEYRLFNPTQQIDSDFDKEVRGLLDKE